MPNPQEVLTVAAIVENAARETLPALSEKVAQSLPEIFGPAGKRGVEALAAAPGESTVLEKLAAKFQQTLADLGLPHTATPSQLYDAAQSRGLPSMHSSKLTRHYAGMNNLTFDDGTELTKLVGAGRSGRSETTVFQMADKSASLFEDRSSFFGSSKHTIGFRTQNLRLEEAITR